MNYIQWSDDYYNQAHKLLKVIEKKKAMLKKSTADERHAINADIIQLRNIYYECMLTAKHLRLRAGEMANVA